MMDAATAELDRSGAAEPTETKSAFAARCNVTPGRVSQWIAERKIRETSLAGEGRSARIIIPRALSDLKRTLDVSQRVGLNGLATRIDQPRAAPAAAPAPEMPSGQASTAPGLAEGQAASGSVPPAYRTPGDDIADQIAREKLEHAKHETRRRQREEALLTGRYMLTEDAEAQMARSASMVLTAVESGFNEMADALAAEFAIPRRDVLHAMMKAFRPVRDKASRAFADRAAAIEAAEQAARAAEEDQTDEDDETS